MTATTSEVVAPFTVLVVCTGNICRSPLAEQLLRSRLSAAGVQAKIVSAGSRAMVDDDMTSEASALLSHYGGDPVVHSARQLTPDLVADFDLILTASREHRSEVVSLFPRSSRYTFTLTQFARLVAAEPGTTLAEERPTKEDASRSAAPAHLRAFIAKIAATRGLTPPPAHPDLDDIEDPYRRSQTIWQSSGQAIDEAVTTIATALIAASGTR